MHVRNIKAVIFDMDGTLLDSEILTEKATAELLHESNITETSLDYKEFYGTTWRQIGEMVQKAHPELGELDLPAVLQEKFHRLSEEHPPPEIPGSRNAMIRAHGLMPTAIATSSNRESVQDVVKHMGIGDYLTDYVCADDYGPSKPDPTCFLLAAERLDVAPSQCLVFEDSIAGLQAANKADMTSVAVTYRSADVAKAEELADFGIGTFKGLPGDFFEKIMQPS
ncbi:MAG: HAD family phosphatase [Myxococcota bacterium]|nr:HAD family phosphatase [Myxococcota bacterium]